MVTIQVFEKSGTWYAAYEGTTMTGNTEGEALYNLFDAMSCLRIRIDRSHCKPYISLGGIGKVQLRPKVEDIDVAHKIWTELVTRKAALPIDTEHDIISEVYDSWYALFDRVRILVSQIPARLVREDRATEELVQIATKALNQGLRPHLTRWQARFRNWYVNQEEKLKTKTPQEVQREFPEYDELMSDLQRVNEDLIQYAEELQKLVRGR